MNLSDIHCEGVNAGSLDESASDSWDAKVYVIRGDREFAADSGEDHRFSFYSYPCSMCDGDDFTNPLCLLIEAEILIGEHYETESKLNCFEHLFKMGRLVIDQASWSLEAAAYFMPKRRVHAQMFFHNALRMI